jgi:uncharacterized membrane protein (DUF2068 family)
MKNPPLRETLLLWLVLSLTVLNLIRFWSTLRWRAVLEEFGVNPAPWIGLAASGIFAVAGGVVLWGLWDRKPWAARITIGAAIAYTLWFWLERLVFHEPRPNRIFVLSLNLILLIFTVSTSLTLSKEAHEQSTANRKAP